MTLNENETVENKQGLVECPHVKECVRKAKVNETLKRTNFDLNSCDDCKLSSSTFCEVTSDYVYDTSYWLCLYCGKCLCGRNMNSHGLAHFQCETSESVSHAVVLNLAQDCVWCYECDGYVDISLLKEIKLIIKLVKEHRPKDSSEAEAVSSGSLYPQIHYDDLKLYCRHVRGLVNLGNTCYMNSVLQCLSKTPYLKKILEYLKEHTFEFRLNVGKLKTMKNFDEKTILGKINPATDSVTINLFETISELNNSRTDGIRDCYNPSLLQRSIAQIVHQFSGSQQHDSHELMRHLLEIVRSNDFNRAKSAIKNCLETELQIDNKILKTLAQEITNQLITAETVFKGFLVSTLQCEQCRHKTQREECFLDLSLPIHTYSTNNPDEDGNSSPYASNMYGSSFISSNDRNDNNNWKDSVAMRQQDLLNKKHNQINQQFLKNSQTLAADANTGLSKGTASATGIASTTGNSRRAMRRAKKMAECHQKKDSRHYSVNNSSTSSTLSPNYNQIELSKTNIKIVRDEGSTSDTKNYVQGDFVSSTMQSSDDYTETSSMNAHQSENELADSFENVDEDDEEKSSSTNNDSFMDTQSSAIDTKNNDYSTAFSCSNEDKMMDIDCLDDTQRKCNIEFENEECSVTTCLFRFTEAEMLDERNKVVCERCTKSKGKIIYQKFKKQLLISQPPPVLILHLKRFEAHLSSYRKVVKGVTFSMKLDLKPFCWKGCRTDSIFNQYLYSLYGIVEHSGTLRSGHYVAYVKVRQFSENLEMIKSQIKECTRLENLTAELLISNMLSSLNSKLSSNSSSEDANNFRWFRISDSTYNVVSEKEVLSAQAYLMFYERIA